MGVPDPQLLNWVVQGGSFALIVAVMFYLGYVLIPKTIATFERQSEKFDQINQRTEARHAVELEKRDQNNAAITAALSRLSDSQDRMAERLARLEARNDERDDRERDERFQKPLSGRVKKLPPGSISQE